MSDSKSGSKSDLNESNMPLLDEEEKAEKTGETPEKEHIEMKEEIEKEDSGTEKDKKGKKKEKKEKKPKEPKEKKPKGPNCVDKLSEGLNLTLRDPAKISTAIDVDFDDVIAEPSSTHGLDPVWRLTYVLFTQTKLWLYRIIASLIAIPLTLVWALVFSVMTVVHVWLLGPLKTIFNVFVAVIRHVVQGVMEATLEPVCQAVGAVFAHVGTRHVHRNVYTEIDEA